MGINYLFTNDADTEIELVAHYNSLDNYAVLSVKSHVSYVSEDVDSEPYGDWSEYEISLQFLNLCYMLLSLYPEKTLSEALTDFVDELIILADKQKAEFESIQRICKARYNALLDASSEVERLMFHSFK